MLAPGAARADTPTSPQDKYPETVAPPRSKQIPFEKRSLQAGEEPDPAALARDPRLLSSYLDTHPEKLDAKAMDPGLLATISQLLMSSGRYFDAERLLYQGTKRWPDNGDIGRRWASLVVRLGRTEAVRDVLEHLAPTSTDPAVFYLLGLVHIRHDPRTTDDVRTAVNAWEKVLAMNPAYRDDDGTTPDQIRSGIKRLRRDLPPEPVQPGSVPGGAAPGSVPGGAAPGSAPAAPSGETDSDSDDSGDSNP